MLYAVIEQLGLDIRQIQLYGNRLDADAAFEAMAFENSCHEYEKADLQNEPPKVLRFAGDDAYSVSVYHVALF